MRLCLYQPEIPQNTGTLLRTAACFGVGIDIIEPCGFILSDRRLKRAGMDYIMHVDMKRHISYDAFKEAYPQNRVILLSTAATLSYLDFAFHKDDLLLVGREADGVPPALEATFAHKVHIPMRPTMRSLNVAIAASIVLAEALRQTQGFMK